MRVLSLLLLAWVVACTPARRRVGGDIVRSIHFDGNGGLFSGHNDLQVRNQLESKASSFGLMVFPLNFLVDPVQRQNDLLARDAYRLEVWYAHHGWFDARVVGWEARRLRPQTKRLAGVVDIRGQIDVGEPSVVRSFTIVGTTTLTRTYANLIKRTSFVKEGVQFDLAAVQDARALLENELRQHGYAYAVVEMEVDAFPNEHVVDVRLLMKPGIQAKFGELEVVGNAAVAKHLILQNVRIEEGKPYRLDRLVDAQNRLFGMGTFSLVTVNPDLSDPTKVAVPLQVRVTENKFRSLRFGVGLRAQGLYNWEPLVSARLKHAHFMHQLIRLELAGQVGLSGYSPDPKFSTRVVPIWKVAGTLSYPRIFGQKLTEQVEVKFERGFQQGIARFDNPEFDFRSIFKPSDVVVLTVGPHLEFFEYVDLGTVAQQAAQRLYGAGFNGVYRLTSLDFGLTLDWRDDKLSARRGSFFSTTGRLALPLVADDPTFFALAADWRLFRPIRVGNDVPFTWATRMHGKITVPIGDSTIPYPERVFLGGASSMRGFPNRAMGPYQTLFVGDSRYFLPEGGLFGVVLNEELRYHGSMGLTYALFADVGTLANPPLAGDGPAVPIGVSLISGFRYAGGVGVRYASSIGPIRLDLALRPKVPEDSCPNELGCVTGGASQRHLDIVRSVDPTSDWPGIMVFFALGEAI